ncbi:MAG: cytoplasmic chaperone TorD family [Geobacteraceae bacterium]|nr:MAG: cytoplasmic chaperone TorD family [Geobacteraceae bacterium]
MSVTNEMTLYHNLEISYRLLSASLYQPSFEWGDADIFAHLKGALQVVAPAAAAGAEAMEGVLRAGGETELTLVYARLFVGPFSLGAPPYGSFYLEPEKKVMGETTVAVQEFYRQAGLALDEDFTELHDHMAVELEFISYLLRSAVSEAAERGEAASTEWVDRRREFLRRFLVGWYGDFCAAIREATDNPFYLAYADCLEAVVGRDRELLGLK